MVKYNHFHMQMDCRDALLEMAQIEYCSWLSIIFNTTNGIVTGLVVWVIVHLVITLIMATINSFLPSDPSLSSTSWLAWFCEHQTRWIPSNRERCTNLFQSSEYLAKTPSTVKNICIVFSWISVRDVLPLPQLSSRWFSIDFLCMKLAWNLVYWVVGAFRKSTRMQMLWRNSSIVSPLFF
jgi:hypothetical protein